MENKENKVTVIKLICKNKESNGKKWINYSTKKGATWYNVRFVKGCQTPKVVKIDEHIMRAFIKLNASDTFNIADSAYGKILYVETYGQLTEDEIERAGKDELKSIKAYREKRESEKVSFLAPDEPEIEDESEDLPF